MSTALGIIKSAMRKVGVLTKTEDPSADESADGLEMLNDLLASMSNDSMVIYARALENFTVTGGTSQYTIGTGGDFNTARPIKLISAYVRIGTIDYYLTKISDEQLAGIHYKDLGSTPQYINYTYAYPLGVINLFPIPSEGGQLYILSEKQLAEFTLNQTVSLPPGWRRMLIYNLAMEMMPEYGQPVTQEIKMIADQSKYEIKRAIMAARPMHWENGSVSGDNIYTGWIN